MRIIWFFQKGRKKHKITKCVGSVDMPLQSAEIPFLFSIFVRRNPFITIG